MTWNFFALNFFVICHIENGVKKLSVEWSEKHDEAVEVLQEVHVNPILFC